MPSSSQIIANIGDLLAPPTLQELNELTLNNLIIEGQISATGNAENDNVYLKNKHDLFLCKHFYSNIIIKYLGSHPDALICASFNLISKSRDCCPNAASSISFYLISEL